MRNAAAIEEPNPWMRWRPLALAGLLLIIAATRILRFDLIFLGYDEFWSVYQGYGNWLELLRWNPYDWPPLYYLVLDGWVALVGIQPLVLRFLSVLFFLLGSAFFYQVMRQHGGHRAAWLGSFCWAGLAYLVFLSSELRGYALMWLVLPMAWFFALRLSNRPGRRNAIAFSLAAVACLYTTYITVFPLAMLVFYVLWKGRRALRQRAAHLALAAVLMAILILPIPFFLLPTLWSRVKAIQGIELLPLAEALLAIYRFWFGELVWVMAFLMALGVAVLFARRRIGVYGIFTFVWAFPTMILLYLSNPLLGFFQIKYASWTLIGIPAFLGHSLAQLPRLGRLAALAILAMLIVQPFPWQRFNRELLSQLEVSLHWLQGEWYAGDALLLAEDHECPDDGEIWNYMFRAYFPGGLEFTDEITGQRRLWFVTADGSPASRYWEALRRDYVERHFVGPPGCLFRLYEGPPEREGILFDNGMRFLGAEFLLDGEPLPPAFAPQLHEGEEFGVRMWWQVSEPLPRDYSVGVFLFDKEGRVLLDEHGPPRPTYPYGAPMETSRWEPGQLYYEDRALQVPFPLLRQELELRMAVYYWEEPAQRFAAPGSDALGMVPLMTIHIDAW